MVALCRKLIFMHPVKQEVYVQMASLSILGQWRITAHHDVQPSGLKVLASCTPLGLVGIGGLRMLLQAHRHVARYTLMTRQRNFDERMKLTVLLA